MYSKTVFDIIKTIKPSYRNEIEITSVNNVYVQNQNKFTLSTRVLNGWWTDAGTLESYKRANEYAYKQ
jgi:glucose-1-phosphate thymidylyltransferase